MMRRRRRNSSGINEERERERERGGERVRIDRINKRVQIPPSPFSAAVRLSMG